MQLHVLWRIKGECQSHVRQRLGDDHATLEIYAATYAALIGNRGFHLLCSRDVERGVHDIARKLYVAAVLYGKRLEWNDGHRILHLSVAQGVFAQQPQRLCWVIGHAQRASAHQIHIVRLVGIQVGNDMCSLRDVDGHVHAEASHLRTAHYGLGGVAEVSKLHQLVQLVVGSQRRVT